MIQDIAKTGVTLLIVTHEMSFARQVADRIVFMEEGGIVEVAPPDVFFESPASDRARAFISTSARALRSLST